MTPSQQPKRHKTMTLKQMIAERYQGNRQRAANSCGDGISMENLGMCISRGYTVKELKDGGFVMITKKTKIFAGLPPMLREHAF